MRLKDDVRVRGISPEAIVALIVIQELYAARGYECMVTSITDGDHMSGSHHHTGNAIDFRTVHVSRSGVEIIADEARVRLPGYDIVIEGDHLHVEYDPK